VRSAVWSVSVTTNELEGEGINRTTVLFALFPLSRLGILGSFGSTKVLGSSIDGNKLDLSMLKRVKCQVMDNHHRVEVTIRRHETGTWQLW
jgi:hypothetical protein